MRKGPKRATLLARWMLVDVVFMANDFVAYLSGVEGFGGRAGLRGAKVAVKGGGAMWRAGGGEGGGKGCANRLFGTRGGHV